MTKLATAQQHDRIRATTLLTLPVPVVVKRRTASRTSGGGTIETLAVVSSGPGRLATMGGEMERVWLDRLGSMQGWMVTVEHSRDIRVNDQLVIGSRTFEVLGFDQDRSVPLSQRVAVIEVLG